MNTLKRFLSGTIHSVSEHARIQEVIDKINVDKVSACLVEKGGVEFMYQRIRIYV